MFCLVFVFSAAFTAFIVLTVCLSLMYLVYDFIINKQINAVDRPSIRGGCVMVVTGDIQGGSKK